MKILQVIHKPQNRGAETFACQLSNHLLDLGHEVKVLAVFPGEANLPFKGEIISLGASPSKRFFDFSAWRKLSRIIKQFEPQVVQANAGDTLKYLVFSKFFFKWKAPIISRNASEMGRYFTSIPQKKINSFFYKNIDHVISVSKASEKDIQKHFPFLENKTEVIPVGLERKPVDNDVKLEPAGIKHIVHVGGFTFEKDHKGLLQIFSIISESHPDVFLHLVGDGPLRTETEDIVKKAGLENRVKFYGFVNNPLSYIKAADVLVLPSIIEGLPGVLLEAMYCKTPVVAYNVGGISEIVTSKTGFLIKKGDQQSFANAIIETLNFPDVSRIEDAHKMVMKDYMNDRIAQQFASSYKTFSWNLYQLNNENLENYVKESPEVKTGIFDFSL